MSYYQSPQLYNDLLVDKVWIDDWDPYIDKLYVVLIKGKFYTMFSFMFGIGFILFMERASKSVHKPRLLYARRMLVLLGIGLINGILLWYGDILVTYALFGFILLLFYKASLKVLLTFSMGLVAVYNVLIYVSVSLKNLGGKTVVTDNFSPELMEIQQKMNSALNHYGEGSYAEIILQNFHDWLFVFSSGFISALFLVLPMFLLGCYVGKRKLLDRISDHVSFIKKVWIYSLVFGIILQVVKLWGYVHINAYPDSIYTFWYFVGVSIGDPFVCFFYITSIVLLFHKRIFKNLFIHISRVGQMALSHYLLQSVVCTFIFYNYGLGLYGQIGFGVGLVLAFIIYIAQVWFSLVWFKRFRYGPFEWIWRMLTYGSKIEYKREK